MLVKYEQRKDFKPYRESDPKEELWGSSTSTAKGDWAFSGGFGIRVRTAPYIYREY